MGANGWNSGKERGHGARSGWKGLEAASVALIVKPPTQTHTQSVAMASHPHKEHCSLKMTTAEELNLMLQHTYRAVQKAGGKSRNSFWNRTWRGIVGYWLGPG